MIPRFEDGSVDTGRATRQQIPHNDAIDMPPDDLPGGGMFQSDPPALEVIEQDNQSPEPVSYKPKPEPAPQPIQSTPVAPPSPEAPGLDIDTLDTLNRDSVDRAYLEAMRRQEDDEAERWINQYAAELGEPEPEPDQTTADILRTMEELSPTLKLAGHRIGLPFLSMAGPNVMATIQAIADGIQKPSTIPGFEPIGKGIEVAAPYAHAGVMDIYSAITRDPANVILGGPMRALNSALSGIDHIGTWLNQNVVDLRIGGKGEPKVGQDFVAVPNVGGVMDKPKSVTGNMAQSMTQFITGFAIGGRVLGMAGSTGLGATLAKGGFSDLVAFDGHEANLATLIQQFPALKNPVTAYLAHEDKDDSELEKRLQNVVAGAIPNVVFDGFLMGLRAIKAARKVKELTSNPGDTYQEVVERIARGGPNDPTVGTPQAVGKKVEDLLGKPDAPDVTFTTKPPQIPAQSVDDIAARIRVMDTGVPDHVTAKYMYEQAVKGDPKAPPPIPRDGQYHHMGPPAGPDRAPVPPYGVEFTGVHLDETTQDLLMMAVTARTKAFQEMFDRGVMKGAPRFFGKAKVDESQFAKLAEAYRQAELKLARKIGKTRTEQFLKLVEDNMNLRPTTPNRLQGYTAPSYAQVKWYIRNRFTDPKRPVDAATDGALPPRTPPGEPPRGMPEPEPPRSEVYVNWNRINTSDDIKRMMAQMVDADPDAIKGAQRGVRSNATTAAAADEENAWKLLLGERKQGAPKIYTAEEQFALRKLWTSAGNKLTELARLAQEGGPEELFAFRRMMAIYDLVQKEVIGVRTETARALQQWRMPAGGPTEMMKGIEVALATTGGDAVSRKIAEAIVSAAELGGRGAVDQVVKKTWQAKTSDAVREIWINSILSGPKTHLVNILSNSAVLGQSIVERSLAGRFGSILNPVDGVKQGEALAMMYGIRHAWRDAFRLAGKSFMTGETGHGMGKIDLPRTRALSAETIGIANTAGARAVDLLGSIVNTPGKMLASADEFFKTINYRAELYALAYRTASEEVERGLLNAGRIKDRMIQLVIDPPENIRLQAQNFAQYNTFTNDPGEFTKAIMKFRNVVDQKSESAFGLPSASFVVPFVNTPANIFSYTFERTPIAPIMGRFKADIAAGGARANLARAKLALGSAMTMIAYDLAIDGHLTGSGPSGEQGWRKKAALRRGGWQPYSVRVQTGTDANGKPEYRWFAYNRLDPIGAMIGLAADVADYTRNHNDGVDQTALETFAAITFAAADNLMSKTYLSGFSQFVEAIHNPDRRGESYLTRIAASFVPTGVKEIKQTLDPKARQTTDLWSSIQSRVPGMSENVPERLNYWGDAIEYTSGLGTTYDVLSPIYSSSNAKAQPIDREFLKLNYFPSHPGFVRIDGRNVTLRNMPDAKNRLITLTSATSAASLAEENLPDMMTKSGRMSSDLRRLYEFGNRTMKQALNDLIAGQLGQYSMKYETADTDEKVSIIQDVIRSYRKAAQAQVLREFPRIKEIRSKIPERSAKGEDAPF